MIGLRLYMYLALRPPTKDALALFTDFWLSYGPIVTVHTHAACDSRTTNNDANHVEPFLDGNQ
jgi:hypothetical protein